MKTVKEVSRLTGISIRTLRYYDEIGLLKPTQLTGAGYRLYDNQALEKLQAIMFFKELEIPLQIIKEILENPDYDKEQILMTQQALLEKKRNHINGLIELINDVRKGANTMSFEAFTKEDIQKIIDHTLESTSPEAMQAVLEKYGSVEEYKKFIESGFTNEQAMADVLKWYGSKEKAMEAMLQSSGNQEDLKAEQNENDLIYGLFATAKENNDVVLTKEAVERLAECYKKMFCLDNARSILLDLAKEYLEMDKLTEATDAQYGEGVAHYVGHAIRNYYGV